MEQYVVYIRRQSLPNIYGHLVFVGGNGGANPVSIDLFSTVALSLTRMTLAAC